MATRLKVRSPHEAANTPGAMRHVDDTLTTRLAATFVAPTGDPVQSDDGTYEVRVLDDNPMTLSVVKGILTQHHGLEIVEESAL